ncbi:syntaxin-6 [Schistocerca americana]|uniref:syntaxin-6 n=1 Tax=Schistocerca americana TaxID=7009 RepID=UPI001F4F7A36|nr:syntaxin-6 [Schistocerca americana]XP_047115269.1 syntaxin-6 [Schistocerca piceifrons]XP_049812820.1 syntaxin-6 [Schistocerca nitens]XP_049864470.1 syntaxin-6 isoform X1 [Schistocerca gregaria]XP_049960577.1 syntaxin-6 isoform X1 [Schistocerca serialis cubense]
MTLEDPFFVVKDEVCKALNKTRGLYRRWLELHDDPGNSVSKDELEWTTTELRNALRSIEWDLEDLEDTIGIVEKNPGKFKIDNKELSSRRNFIDQTRDEVKTMKDKMNISRGRDRDRTARQPLLENSPVRVPSTHGTTKYSKLENELDSPNRQFLDDTLQQQNHMLRSQDEQLDIISDSVGTLKTVSRQIGNELDEQAVMLDEFGNEMENTDSKLDSTMKRVAKVFHISNDRRQWIAIGVLSGIMVIVIILFIFT